MSISIRSMSMVKDAPEICCKEWAESQPAVINHTNGLPPHAFDEIIGTSAVLRAVLKRVEIVGPGDSTVLILGETGTGKELIARAVHNCSRRSLRPFVTMNCAAIPQSLIAAELFGHEKGAFTGAVQRRLGRFEQAEGGTLFLDEIGDLPAEAQLALLRVLQEREFERVGGNRSIHADAAGDLHVHPGPRAATRRHCVSADRRRLVDCRAGGVGMAYAPLAQRKQPMIDVDIEQQLGRVRPRRRVPRRRLRSSACSDDRARARPASSTRLPASAGRNAAESSSTARPCSIARGASTCRRKSDVSVTFSRTICCSRT